ncbi:transposase [Enterococcus hirae]|uniref:transposase n=1 Tax=Enterococcus hirae TaxID=1354 RepID=UPI001F61FA1E|nr:transposase [Enterococcus hirae]MBO1116483.1 transposase [Enterococcus hirae]
MNDPIKKMLRLIDKNLTINKVAYESFQKNPHIKTVKRVAYGFKSFENMNIRNFLSNQLIHVK